MSPESGGAWVNASLTTNMSIASSGELLTAVEEDLTDASAATINEVRLGAIFRAVFYNFQWQFVQGQRGLLPTYSEEDTAKGVRTWFRTFRSFEGWWERDGVLLVPEFVEWVEEQRAKAA